MVYRIYVLLTIVLLNATGLMAQAPAKMSYQAVVRNASNALVSNSNVGMRISILQGNVSGNAVYVETQTPTSNDNGLVSLEIGGGTAVNGSLSAIDWADGPYFIKTETDPNGGQNYTITGTSQLLSVPYALYAETSAQGIPTGGTAGQVLEKVDGTDYNAQWVTPTSGGGARLQLFATSTTAQAKLLYVHNRYTFYFNNVVGGDNTTAWTNNNTYTIPGGMGGLYNVNLAIVETSYGSSTSPVLIFPEIQITSGTSVRYYYGVSSPGSGFLQGDDTDGSNLGTQGLPTSFVRSTGNFMIPLQAGDVIKVFYRSGSNAFCSGCEVSFSTDGSTYLSIVKMN